MTGRTRTAAHGRSPVHPVAIGPVRIGDHTVAARPCRPDDADAWRTLRLRNEHAIAPFWPRSDRPWSDRHTRNEWIRELLESRRAMRAGHRLSFAIDVDGRFAGQCTLSSIDHRLRTAEVGVWVDPAVAHKAVGTLATGLVVDHGVSQMGLRRIFAPTATTNRSAQKAMHRSRFRRQCPLPDFFDVGDGDERVPHELWSLNPADLPDGGMTTLTIQSGTPDAAAVRVHDVTRRVRRPRILSARLDDATTAVRFQLGRLRETLRTRRPPSSFPTELPVGSIRPSSRARPTLRLRRWRTRTDEFAPMSPSLDRSRRHPVLDSIRPGSWFGPGDSVTYDLHDGGHPVVHLRLAGSFSGSAPAELALLVDAGRDHTDGDATDVIVAAVRTLVLAAWSAGISAIATGTDPDDAVATAVAVESGFSRLGQLTEFAVREGIPRDVDVWTVSPG